MINWISEHYAEIFAILFGLYAVARMVVVLTPTPKDDIAVEKVGVWLNKLAKLFGLDMKQGINKKGE
jgi:hypothetical protein